MDIFSGEGPDEHLNNFLSCFSNLGSLKQQVWFKWHILPYLHETIDKRVDSYG
jgi:hypothetical protein